MDKNTEQTWDGGRIHTSKSGKKTYYVRKRINGKLFEFSTGARTTAGAMAQLKLFEADPAGYQNARVGDEGRAPLYLDAALAEEFLTWSRDVKENSAKWIHQQKGYVSWWADRLEGVDLRRAKLGRDIKQHIPPKAPARAPKIAVLKCFYSWLRTVKHELTPAEDPTLDTLRVPQTRPEQWKRVKAISKAQYVSALAKLKGHWKDGLLLLGATGWHTTELERFATEGSTEPHPHGEPGVVLVSPRSKAGDVLRTHVEADVGKAAKRLLKRGTFSTQKFARALKAACEAGKVPTFTPGVLRHSVATWAVNAGADLASVAAFLNHKSPATTRRFYSTLAVAKRIPTLASSA